MGSHRAFRQCLLMARADEESVETLETAFKRVWGILGPSSALSGVIAWMMAASTGTRYQAGSKQFRGGDEHLQCQAKGRDVMADCAAPLSGEWHDANPSQRWQGQPSSNSMDEEIIALACVEVGKDVQGVQSLQCQVENNFKNKEIPTNGEHAGRRSNLVSTSQSA